MTPLILNVIEPELASRLGDQMFSIVLLVVFAAYMLRKQKQLEDKLDKYMAEDREEMKEVIQKNTQAFDRIAAKISLIVLCLTVTVGLASCVTKKSISTQTEKKDSSNVVNVIRSDFVSTRTSISKDSVLTAPQREVGDTLCKDDLKPLLTQDGDTVANTHIMSAPGITGTMVALPDGRIAFSCKADSLMFVIRNLTYIKDSTVRKFDSLNHEFSALEQKSATEKDQVKTILWFEFTQWAIIGVFGLVVLIVIVRSLLKKQPLL